MRFGILAIPYMRGRGEEVGLAGSDPARFQTLMTRLKEQIQFAESVGFDAFAMTEQHMQVEGIETTTNPLLWDYFVAQHTKTMRVGQIGMNIPCVNPIKLAEDIAMLDHFTGGRVFAGFTRGNTPRWTATFGQHLGLMSTESDKSEHDKRNRAAFAEGWEIIKALWTNDTVRFDGEFWKVPYPVDWDFNPTRAWGRGVNAEGKLTEIGIVPRPLQQPHPPIYAPFSFSIETVKFWAREGGKMLCMVSPEKEKYIRIMMDAYMEEAATAGRNPATGDAVAIGGHLTMGRDAAESADIHAGFEELFNFAYNAPPYHVPMGRVFKGSRHEVLDHVAGVAERYGVEEFFLWHHIGYFPQEQEMAMLNEFAEGVIREINGPAGVETPHAAAGS